MLDDRPVRQEQYDGEIKPGFISKQIDRVKQGQDQILSGVRWGEAG